MSRPLIGVELLLDTGLHRLCTGPINYHCELWYNGMLITPESILTTQHGDFGRIIVRRSSQLASYALVFCASSFYRRLSAADFHSDIEHILAAQRRLQGRNYPVTHPWDNPTEGLRPPGNGVEVLWLSKRMDRMDSFFRFGNYFVIVDGPACENNISTTSKPLLLSEHLRKPEWNQSDSRVISLDNHLFVSHQPRSCTVVDVQTTAQHALDDDRISRSLNLTLSEFEIVELCNIWSDFQLDCDLEPWITTIREDIQTSLSLFTIEPNPSWQAGDTVHIYTDGSFLNDPPRASWSFIAVLNPTCPYSASILGCSYGTCTDDSSDPLWCGIQTLGSFTAEVQALFMAAWWALKLPDYVYVEFFYDSMSAAQMMAGRWKLNLNETICVGGRVFHQLHSILRPQHELRYTHVKAHTGQCFSEFADHVAGMTNNKRFCHQPKIDISHLLRGSRPQIAQIPLMTRLYKNSKMLPTTMSNLVTWNLPKETDFVPPPFVKEGPKQQKSMSGKRLPLWIRMASYNVNTLNDKSGTYELKPEYLRSQCEHRQFHVVALQETRARQELSLDTPNYLRLISPSSGGNGGVELWFHKTLEVLPGECFRKDLIQVVHFDPHFLLASMTFSVGRFFFASCHAPHSAHPDATREQWWKTIELVLNRLEKGSNIFVLGDFNVQIGTSFQNYIGTLLDPIMNHNGRLLEQFLSKLSLWAPATFSYVQHGPTETWIAPSGQYQKRLDLILIPLRYSEAAVTTWVDYELHAGQERDDHFATCLDCQISLQQITQPAKRMKQISRAALRDQQNRETILEMFRNLAEVSWETDVHTHYDVIAHELYENLVTTFPERRKPPRKDYVSESTWLLWNLKARLKKDSKRIFAKDRLHLMKLLFETWRDGVTSTETSTPLHELAYIYITLKGLRKRIRESLSNDRRIHIDGLATSVASASPKDLYAQLRTLGIGSARQKKGNRTLPLLRHPEGPMATDATQAQEIWQQHAASLEFGEIMTRFDLWQNCVKHQTEKQMEQVNPRIFDVPTLIDMEKAFRKVRYGKATGPDQLTAEIMHEFPVQMSLLFQPLLMKMLCHQAEPIAMKGGVLVRAFKHKGSPQLAENYRGLLISNHLAKALHSSCRSFLMPFYCLSAQPMQLGGKPGASVTQASHISRTFLSWAKKRCFSAAILFLDIRSAFYRVIRPLIAQSAKLHEQLVLVVDKFGLPPQTVQDLLAHLHSSSIMKEFGVPEFHEQMTAELHQSTWFSTPLLSTLVGTQAGTRPGNPFADLVFNYLFAYILRDLKDDLETVGLIFSLEHCGQRTIWPEDFSSVKTRPVLESVWADDLALMILSQSAKDIENRVRTAAAILIDRCTSFGLLPNFEKGKSEALLLIRGAGSVAVRKKIYGQTDPAIAIQTPALGEIRLRIITQYVHLGGLVTVQASDEKEMMRRLAMGRSRFDQYKRTLFQCPKIPLQTRLQLFGPFVASLCTFGIGNLSMFTSRHIQQAEQRLILMYKQILKPHHTRDQILAMPMNEVVARLQLPTYEIHLHVERLRTLGRLILSAPDALWAMLEHQQQWFERCRESLDWMYTQLSTTTTLGPPEHHHDEWMRLPREAPRRWKGLILRAQRHAILQIGRQWSQMNWTTIILELLQIHGVQLHWPGNVMSAQTPVHVCGPCRRRFASKTAWAVHMFKKHDRIQSLRLYCGDTICLRCAKNYWTAARLQRHLTYSEACAIHMKRHVVPQQPGPGINSRAYRKNEGPALRPPMEVAVVQPNENQFVPDFDQTPDAIMEGLMDWCHQDLTEWRGLHPNQTPWDLVSQIRDVLLKEAVAYDVLLQTFTDFKAQVNNFLSDDLPIGDFLLIQRALETVSWLICPSWLVPPSKTEHVIHESRMQAALWLETVTWASLEQIPLCATFQIPKLFRERVIVHFFCGHRRKDDLQSFLMQLQCPEGFVLHILSIDIIFGCEADLMNPQWRQTWLCAFRSGYVLAFYAGPPCETYSAARHVECEGSRVRPVRSSSHPWGLPALSIRELIQVQIGNMLMWFVIMCFVLQAARGLFAMLEHPAPPKDISKVSIWRTKLWITVRCLNITEITILQGYYGAPSVKPTTLAFTGQHPNLEALFHRHRSCSTLPTEVSVGKDSSGEFKTSRLKAYPGALCKAMASVLEEWMKKLTCDSVQEIPTEIMDLFGRFEKYCDAPMGPDYVPPSNNLIQFA